MNREELEKHFNKLNIEIVDIVKIKRWNKGFIQVLKMLKEGL